MPRKPKQLILEREEQENISNSDFRLHFDYSDSEYAEEHYGYYLMTTLTPNDIRENNRPRSYLYAVPMSNNRTRVGYAKEFLDKETLVGDKFKYRLLSHSAIDAIFNDRTMGRKATGKIVKGLRNLIGYLDSEDIMLENYMDVGFDIQLAAFKFWEGKERSSLVDLSGLLRELGKADSNFKRVNYILPRTVSKVKALSSSVIYQLEVCSKNEITEIMESAERTRKSPMEGRTFRKEKMITQDEMCFSLYKLYAFILLIMIRHGLNLEVLTSWKVRRNKQGDYELDANSIGDFIEVEGVKNRGNKIISSVIRKSSDEGRHIEFLLRYLKPLYDLSDDDGLWQYYDAIRREVRSMKADLLKAVNKTNSKNGFYVKYKIVDEDSKRIESIDHRALRKSHTYQDSLRGKLAFERQMNKSHKSGETTKRHYEDQNQEWAGALKHKIALSQNLVVGIFKGDIAREDHEIAGLFEGVFANCKDNKSPVYEGAPTLKDNEYCSDWTKCLSCENCTVIPSVHGSVIYAWIEYMEAEKKEAFIREQDWEKVYLLDYTYAKSAVSRFKKEEKEHSEKEAVKHKAFVRTMNNYSKTAVLNESESGEQRA